MNIYVIVCIICAAIFIVLFSFLGDSSRQRENQNSDVALEKPEEASEKRDETLEQCDVASEIPGKALENSDVVLEKPEKALEKPDATLEQCDEASEIPGKALENSDVVLEKPEKALEKPDETLEQCDEASEIPGKALENSDVALEKPEEASEKRDEGFERSIDARYVFEDWYEDTEYSTEHGELTGYRILPNFFIFPTILSKVLPDIDLPTLLSLKEPYYSNLMDTDDLLKILRLWDKISALRVKAGEPPLGEKGKYFWGKFMGRLAIIVGGEEDPSQFITKDYGERHIYISREAMQDKDFKGLDGKYPFFIKDTRCHPWCRQRLLEMFPHFDFYF